MTLTEVPTDRIDALEAKIDVLTGQIAVLAADAEHRRRQRAAFDELTGDLARVSDGAMAMVTERLAEAERRGYFEFARSAAGVADRVVTGFDEDDLEQLGDNIVTILETIREITQPEMLALLARVLDAVRAERSAVELEPTDPPSLWTLARQVRDPDVRRGIERALHTLRSVSVATSPAADDHDHTATNTSRRGAST